MLRLRQNPLHLISNAVEFHTDRGCRVRVRSRFYDYRLSIAVIDNRDRDRARRSVRAVSLVSSKRGAAIVRIVRGGPARASR